MKIYIIRHTTPSVSTDICYGITDLELAKSYWDEKQKIKNIISDFKPDIVFSSPLKRCHTLAKDLFPNYEISIDDNLKELDFGNWEMKPWSEIPIEEIEPWSGDFLQSAPPQGETFNSLVNRANRFIEHLITLPAESNVAVVTHSGVIRAFLMKWLAIPHTHIFNLDLDYGAILKVKIVKNNVRVKFIL